MKRKPLTARMFRSFLTIVTAMVIAVAGVAIRGLAAEPEGAGPPSTESTEPVTAPAKGDLAKLEEEWGIKLVGLRETAAGYFLDLRLRVLDPEKAAPLLSRQIQRHVIVEKSGAILKVPSAPMVGSLRSSVRTPNMVKANRIYSALFANPGRHVRTGDRVTLVLGDFRAEHLSVE